MIINHGKEIIRDYHVKKTELKSPLWLVLVVALLLISSIQL